jgi:N-acetylneuraminic acid mutarotase
MPTGESLFAVAVVNGRVYAVSGTGPKDSWDRGVEVYDPVTDTWTSIASYPIGVGLAAAGSIDGVLYVVGGNAYVNREPSNVGTVEAYQPTDVKP